MDFPYICDHQVGYSPSAYLLYLRWFLTCYIYPFFQDWLHWWLLILHKTYDHSSVAISKVTEHFIYSHFWIFSNWLLSALNSIFLPEFVFFSWWSFISPIFVITKCATLLVDIHFPEGVLDLVSLSIFSGLAALMSADIVQNLWSLVCSYLNSYWAFHLFPLLIFFKLVAFCTELNLFTPICFVLFMIMDLQYVCDHQVGYSAGGYSSSPMWFLTWCIYPFFQDCLHCLVLILHKTYDHWSVAVLTANEHFIYSHFWFFSNLLLSALNSICLQPFVLFSLW